MADTVDPYIKHNPGDLITAEDWNSIQVATRNDIATQVAASIAKVKDVDHSKNSDQLAGKSVDELLKYILDQVIAQIPMRTGYMRIFCNLKLNTDKILEHKLGQPPVVDLYQLNYFQGLCAKSDKSEDSHIEWVLFYLYHADERRLRLPNRPDVIDIETTPKYRIPWKSLLDQLKEAKLLNFTDDTTLDDLETDFWQALFKDPNDDFDPDDYCHSPWFEKCCGEKRSVADLTKHGDFDDIYLKVVPQKTINFLKDPDVPAITPEPTNVLVSQLDNDTIALHLIEAAVYPDALSPDPQQKDPQKLQLPGDFKNRLPLMVLLKV
jgi:hypothetical protein